MIINKLWKVLIRIRKPFACFVGNISWKEQVLKIQKWHVRKLYIDSQSTDSVNRIKPILPKIALKMVFLFDKNGHILFENLVTYFFWFFFSFLSPWHYIEKQETKTSTMNWWNLAKKSSKEQREQHFCTQFYHPVLTVIWSKKRKKNVTHSRIFFSKLYKFLLQKDKW